MVYVALRIMSDGYSTDGLRKDELASLLEEHFNNNATQLSGNPDFKDYYNRTSSPTKREARPAAAIVSDGEIRTAVRKRRVTKVKEETDV